MDPILIVLLKVFWQDSTFKSGGAGPPETKVGGPRPMWPPISATYGRNLE